MRISTFSTFFKVYKFLFTFTLALVSFLCILELHQSEIEQKIQLENLKVKLRNLTGSVMQSEVANYKLWRCKWTGQYFVVKNFAQHSLETVITVEHPKLFQYKLDFQLSEFIKWSVPLFEKAECDQQDVYFQQRLSKFETIILCTQGTEQRTLYVPGKKLLLNFKFKEAFNISSILIQLAEDELSRPSIFRYKIAGEKTIDHSLPVNGFIFEFDVPHYRAFLPASHQLSCELEITNSSAAEFISIDGIGVYGLLQ